MFHAFDFKPLRRYKSGTDKTYIGFHQTKPEYAMGIAKTGFRINTGGKARSSGAFICAEVNMKRVRVVNYSELCEVQNTDAWWNEYDTIYYAHEQENRDEFCVKDPAQILNWIIIIDDDRLRRYGLDTDFNNTCCNCI
ncbi:unnamed protein product [Rotaria socialis]|uniref:Uncharacterized protein n=1 Tax=Rotaria socialis TaxID=392032 RepID=A0A820NSG2_9BILA|nr:unnamed protein product [Rotaria socialis]CAF4490508.1 unnamed protein product [Rotaria socialis]